MDPANDLIERFEKTGVWGPNPWFLNAEHGDRWDLEWRQIGLPREKRVIADAALRKIFPPEVVREISRDPRRGAGHIITLFGGVMTPGLVAPLLDLGVNADLTKPWGDPTLLARLRMRDSHADAAFEVAVHAGLIRAGAKVRPVPVTPQGKSHDFNVEFKGSEYELEAKAMHESELEVVSETLNSALAIGDLTVPGFEVVLRGSQRLAELALESPPTVVQAIPEIVNSFTEAAAVLRSKSEPGTYPAGTWGQIEAERGYEHGSMTDLLLPDLPEEKQARRVHWRVLQGLKQLTGQRPGILVIGLYGAAQPDLVERLVLADVRSGATLAKKCWMVVLCERTSVRERGFHMPRRVPLFYAFSPLLTHRLRKAEMMLAAAVSSTHWAVSRRMDPVKPGQVSIRVGTSREPQTMWGGSSIVLAKPGDSGTLVWDPSKLPALKIRK